MIASLLAAALMISPVPGDVRYGWVDACPKKDYSIPCGPWTLTLGSGKTVQLKDAAVHPVLPNGKTDTESSAPIAISGNGRFVGYFRKSDRRFVVRDVGSGSVKALPGKAAMAPKGVGMLNVDPLLSPDGRRIVIDYYDDAAKLPSLLVDLRTRAIHKIPGNETVQASAPTAPTCSPAVAPTTTPRSWPSTTRRAPRCRAGSCRRSSPTTRPSRWPTTASRSAW